MARASSGQPAFSPSDAALEGVRILREHWRVVVGWALFNIVALIAMIVVVAVVAVGIASAAGGSAQSLSGALAGGVASFGTALIEVVLVCGLYRLMARPQEPAFLHLRVGADELRVLGTFVAVVLAIALVAAAGGLLVGQARRIGGGAAALAALAGLAVMAWLAVRLSLAAPAVFSERRFAFGDAWRATRGQVWSLLGMTLLAACLVAMTALFAWLLLLIVSGLTAGFGPVMETITDPEAVKTHPALYLSQTAFELVLTPIMLVLGAAPAMAAWRALGGRREAV